MCRTANDSETGHILPNGVTYMLEAFGIGEDVLDPSDRPALERELTRLLRGCALRFLSGRSFVHTMDQRAELGPCSAQCQHDADLREKKGAARPN